MIVVETVLREIFGQIPDVIYKGKTYPVKFHWGSQDDLNLYMKTESGNTTPLIWLVQGSKTGRDSIEFRTPLKLILAKNSEHKTDRNPVVWDSEFVDVIDPLLEQVQKALMRSGATQIVGDSDNVYREANYSEYNRTIEGKTDTSTKTIDHWNVIIYDADVIFLGDPYCVKQNINFY